MSTTMRAGPPPVSRASFIELSDSDSQEDKPGKLKRVDKGKGKRKRKEEIIEFDDSDEEESGGPAEVDIRPLSKRVRTDVPDESDVHRETSGFDGNSWEEYGSNELDDGAYALKLYEAINGTPYRDGGVLPPLDGYRTAIGQHPLPSTEESDAELAARLAKEDEAYRAGRKKQEEQDGIYARATEQAEQLAEKHERERRERARADGRPGGVNASGKGSNIVFQVTMDAEGRTLYGDEDADNAAHLALVKSDFDCAGMGLRIKKVTYFVNYALNERFEKAKIALGQAGRDDTERTLFHGTPMQNVQPILEDGFKVGGVGGFRVVNGQACGVGVYLASSPMTSLHYTGGCLRMFACRVLVGKTTPTVMHTQPRPVGQNDFDSYASGGVVVARHTDQVLPRYVVEFEHAGRPPQVPRPPNLRAGAMSARAVSASLSGLAVPPVPSGSGAYVPYIGAAQARNRPRKSPVIDRQHRAHGTTCK